MKRSAILLGSARFAGLVLAWLAAATASATEGYALSRGQYWLTDWAAKPVNSLVADVDGDGRADLVAFDPRGDASLWVHRTSSLGKPTPQVAARERFGREGLAAVAGKFTAGAGDDVLAVFADGSVRLPRARPWSGSLLSRRPRRDDRARHEAASADSPVGGRIRRRRPDRRRRRGRFRKGAASAQPYGGSLVSAVPVRGDRRGLAGKALPSSRRPVHRRRPGGACLGGRREHDLSGRREFLDGTRTRLDRATSLLARRRAIASWSAGSAAGRPAT